MAPHANMSWVFRRSIIMRFRKPYVALRSLNPLKMDCIRVAEDSWAAIMAAISAFMPFRMVRPFFPRHSACTNAAASYSRRMRRAATRTWADSRPRCARQRLWIHVAALLRSASSFRRRCSTRRAINDRTWRWTYVAAHSSRSRRLFHHWRRFRASRRPSFPRSNRCEKQKLTYTRLSTRKPHTYVYVQYSCGLRLFLGLLGHLGHLERAASLAPTPDPLDV